jgi:hypothetical protein
MLTFLEKLSSSSHEWMVWALLGACAGAYCFYRGFRALQRRRLILDTPTSKVRSAAMGLVEVSGLAVGPYTVTAPVSSLPCFYCRTLAWQLKQSGKDRQWVKFADETLHVPFYLDDNTGRVLVDPQGAELDLHRDFQDEFHIPLFSGGLDLPANVASFLGRHGVGLDKTVKIEEYCIKPKNALFILGTLASNPGLPVSPTPVRTDCHDSVTFTLSTQGTSSGEALTGRVTNAFGLAAPLGRASGAAVMSSRSGSTAPAAVIRLPGPEKPLAAASMTQQEKVAAALTKAGIWNPAAWEAAGVQYPEVTVSPSSDRSAAAAVPTPQFDLTPATVLKKGEHDPAFFISWRSQRDVVRSLGWKAALMIWGGPALTLLTVYILLRHFAGE